MLRKRFNIGSSRTKSRISFAVPESSPHRNLKRSIFRDPAAIPMLQDIAAALQAQGYNVTAPKPGKACDGFCHVSFPNVEITIVMLVGRKRGNIEFEILTWPTQTLQQRVSGRTMTSPDCPEWVELCSALYAVVTADSRLKSITQRTFREAESQSAADGF